MTVGTPTIYVWDGTGFRDLDTGHIECMECNSIWCEHVERAIRNNLDAEAVWEAPSLFARVQIPVVPTNALWLEASLNYKDRLNAYAVTIEVGGFDFFLGFIHRGEGRLTLRSMVIDWFGGHVDTDSLECRASNHYWQAEKAWKDALGSPVTAFPQQFSVWTTGKCITCTAPADDFADTVPEADERTGSPWR